MAKRAPIDEVPYRPLLDPSVITAALTKPGTAAPSAPRLEPQAAASSKVVEISRPEPARISPQPQRFEASENQAPRVGLGEGRQAPKELVEKFDQEKRI